MSTEELLKKIDDMQAEINELQRKANFFSSLIDMSVLLTSTFDLDELIRKVLEISQSVMNSEASSVMLLNDEKGVLECRVALGRVGKTLEESFTLKLGQGIAGWVAEHRQPVVVPDVMQDGRFYSGTDKRTGFTTRSIMAAPLIAQGKLLGVAEVVNPLDGRSFNEEDLQLFGTFCRGVSVAVQNAQMHLALLNNQRFQQQLELASTIQQGFLPRSFNLSGAGKFEIAAMNQPASLVGGDFYDCIELRPDLLGITIGDVSGKGMPAALYMARLISDFRFQAHQAEDPVPTIKILNQMLSERSQQGMFVTMVYMTLDAIHGRINYVNGGHIPPILFRRSTGELTRLYVSEGIPLGILSDTRFEEAQHVLISGDTVVLFSDGILDAKNSKGEKFSLRQVENAVRGDWRSPRELVNRIVKAVTTHAGNERQFDDITIMALNWH